MCVSTRGEEADICNATSLPQKNVIDGERRDMGSMQPFYRYIQSREGERVIARGEKQREIGRGRTRIRVVLRGREIE